MSATENHQARIEQLKRACSTINNEVCQVLGKALGYPWYKDNQDVFPGTTEAHGVCVGEHIAETIADEAARRIADLQVEIAVLKENAQIDDERIRMLDEENDDLRARVRELRSRINNGLRVHAEKYKETISVYCNTHDGLKNATLLLDEQGGE